MPPAVQYPFSLPSRLVPAAIGGVSQLPLYAAFRNWSYNSEGVGHVGLVPDFVEDLRLHGLTVSDLEPLYRSARGFVEIWRKARARQVSGDLHALRWVPSVPTQTLSFVPSNTRWVSARSGRPICRDGASHVGEVVDGLCQADGTYSAPTVGEILAFHSG